MQPMQNVQKQVTILGLGAMGSALAAALLDAGHTTTVWNRSAGKAGALVDLVFVGEAVGKVAGQAYRANVPLEFRKVLAAFGSSH
jgi:3-hydroxyisobutyrate dehydrogenase-like beta-hydroxyacid dehydrogenase